MAWSKIAVVNGSDPAINALAVTPSDTAEVKAGHTCRAFRVGSTAGDVTLKLTDGSTVTIPAVKTGETISIYFTHVYSTGTAATGITAFL
jgi:hypothetical protein